MEVLGKVNNKAPSVVAEALRVKISKVQVNRAKVRLRDNLHLGKANRVRVNKVRDNRANQLKVNLDRDSRVKASKASLHLDRVKQDRGNKVKINRVNLHYAVDPAHR